MKLCFLLWYVPKEDEPLLIGVYASSTEAKAAIGRLKDKPGFIAYPEGFEVSEYTIGEDHWKDGFVLDETGDAK